MVKSQQELLEEFVNEVQSNAPELTDSSEGSDIDVIAQAVSTAVNELSITTLKQIRKTFFDTAQGPEFTGGEDELETLAVDHFGEAFARPEATFAKGIVTFSRPTDDSGDVFIPAGTVVKTKKTSAGTQYSFETDIDVTMETLETSVSVTATEEGSNSNVASETIVEIEDSLSDSSIVVINDDPMAGGDEAQTDAEYRLTIKRLIDAIKGATLKAIESRSLTIAGVVYSKAIEKSVTVKEFDVLSELTVGDVFRVVRTKIYIADANGSASSTLKNTVRLALDFVRAAGVYLEVVGATPLELDWNGQLTLNPLGPNYATLQNDLSLITDEMKKYVDDLAIGASFIRAQANNYILAKFGPAGTDDITAFFTLSPAADVAATEVQKFIPGNMTV